MEMRAIFGAALEELMAQNDNIVVLDADLAKANGTLGLRQKFPDRAFDVGVAEQNMASVAAGLASYGFVPFISSFTPFASRRIADQVAISISYTKMNVKIVGTDPGVAAEYNGGTHMSMEDVGIMRAIPGLVVFEPVDGVQLKAAMPAIIDYEGPMYIRLYRKEVPTIFPADYKFDLFKADTMRAGADVTIAATGIMLAESLAAAELLAAEGIDAEVINFHTIKPLDTDTLLQSVGKTGCVVSAENHSVVGGLGSAVAEALCDHKIPQKMVGVPDCFGLVGKLEQLKERFGLTAANIALQAKAAINLK